MAPDIQEKGTKKKIMIGAEYTSPGPGKYILPTTVGQTQNDKTKRSSPSFSFGSRHWVNVNHSPGPAYMIDSTLTNKGREGKPSYSISGRAKTPKRDISPGPGAYETDKRPTREKHAPSYSMSPRTSPKRIDVTPSPNIYQLPSTIGSRVPDRKGGPAMSVYGKSGHNHFAADLARTPGPAKYGALPPSQTMKRAPAFSISGRAKTPRDINNVPGPGQYSPENVKAHLETSPRHVIGVKHSQFSMPVLPMAHVD